MKSDNIKKLLNDGYFILKNCISKKIINNANTIIETEIENILKQKKIKFKKKDFKNNYFKLKQIFPKNIIQIKLGEILYKKNLIRDLLLEKKLKNQLISILGPDIEYEEDNELLINEKENIGNDHLFKKLHQEIWSGAGIENILIWIPLNLKQGMGTLEIVRGSHKFGFIENQNREPINMNSYKTSKLNIKNRSVLFLTALTLHKTEINKNKIPRIAIPILIRNFYYKNTGNSDLNNYRKLNYSFVSTLRKILGNPFYSSFRTLGQKRKSIFEKDKYYKK
jgi:hypothetical protein